jgi:hypothetical protein
MHLSLDVFGAGGFITLAVLLALTLAISILSGMGGAAAAFWLLIKAPRGEADTDRRGANRKPS